MSELTQDEHTVLLIAGKDQNMMAIGRWEKPVKDLTARGFLRMLDPVNFIITSAGRAALEREEMAENKALSEAFTRTRSHFKPAPDRPELKALLQRAAASYDAMTPEQKKEQHRMQRKSWVIGEMMLEHPEMSRAEAERIYDAVET